MSYQQVCDLLNVSPDGDLVSAFRQLLYLHPRTECETSQLINCMLPLAMELIVTHFSEADQIQFNLYFYSKV